MIYFDNAATGGFKPDSVINAATAALKFCANPGRSGHRLSLACLERVYVCRKLVCDFLGGYSYERTVFTKNCTEALNIALTGVLKEGDEVVSTVAEHNSVLRPLEHLKSKGVRVSYAPLKEGSIDAREIIRLVTPETRAVVVTLASNVTGAAPDIKAVRAGIPQSTLLICDGAQACGHVAVNMEECGIDALAVAGHKGLLGIQGASALLFSERVNPAPVLYGGTGSESHLLSMPEFYPDRLASGTLSYPAVCTLFEGALCVNARLETSAQTLLKLTANLLSALSAMPKYRAYSKPNPCGIVSFAHCGLPSEEVAETLSERFHVAVRGGLHCAPLAHKALGTFPSGLVRASFAPCQSMREVNALVGALKQL